MKNNIVKIALLGTSIMSIYKYLYQTGIIAKGNMNKYSLENTQTINDSVLKGKTIIFLGSSVTYGSASKGTSFVEYLEKRDGIIPIKEALSGTTLVDQQIIGKDSYITRLKRIDKDIKADLFVCQLSTNDATMKKPLGSISNGFDLYSFDTNTIAGAIEYIISYVKNTWNCPIIFYTGTKYNDNYYEKMIKLLYKIKDKWNIGILDLWNDKEMNEVSKEDYKLYMVNAIHPSKAGYRDWWTPKFEEILKDYIKGEKS